MAGAPLAVAAAHIMGIVGRQIISIGRRQVCILFLIYCHIEIRAAGPAFLHAAGEEVLLELVCIISKGLVKVRVVIRVVDGIKDHVKILRRLRSRLLWGNRWSSLLHIRCIGADAVFVQMGRMAAAVIVVAAQSALIFIVPVAAVPVLWASATRTPKSPGTAWGTQAQIIKAAKNAAVFLFFISSPPFYIQSFFSLYDSSVPA